MESTFDGLAGVLEEAMNEIRTKFKEASKHAGIWESLQAFAAAVDWTVMSCNGTNQPALAVKQSIITSPFFP